MGNKIAVDTTPYCFILFIVFLVLKLTEVVAWSWVWVAAPLWLPITVVLGIVAVVFVVALAIAGISKLVKWIRG